MKQRDQKKETSPNLVETKERKKRKAPRIKVDNEGKLSMEIDSNDQLRDLYGVKSRLAASGLFIAATNALGERGTLYRDLMGTMAEEMEPQGAVEAMLVSQMTATHIAMTGLSGKLMDATSPQLREGYERSMTRLSRTFLVQMDALKRYRGKAQQVVRVERVTVYEGGQAVVGAVQTGGRDDEKK